MRDSTVLAPGSVVTPGITLAPWAVLGLRMGELPTVSVDVLFVVVAVVAVLFM